MDRLAMHAPVGLGLVDREFRFVRVNQVLADLHRLPVDAHVGRTVAELVPNLWPGLRPLYERALAGETIRNHDVSGFALSGEVRHWLVSYYPTRQDGEIIGVGLIVNDITDRRRMELELRTRTTLYAMLSRASRLASESQSEPDLYRELCVLATETGHFRCAWVGIPIGTDLVVAVSAGAGADYLATVAVSVAPANPRSRGPTGQAFLTGRSIIVNDFLRSEATQPWHESARRYGFAASAALPLTAGGQVVAVLTLYADVRDFFTPELVATLNEVTPAVSIGLERFARERQRAHDEAELRIRDRAMQAVSQGIMINDARAPGMPIIYVSPGFERMTGYAAVELIGRSANLLQGAQTERAAVDQIREALRAGRGCTVELLNYRKDGGAFWNRLAIAPVIDDAGVVTHFVGVQTDVTEQRRLEGELRQAHKMEAVGQLAAGIAHDFNNMLMVIHCQTELALADLPPAAPVREELAQIHAAAARATALTRQLLAFSRQQVLQPRAIDLRSQLEDLQKMLRRLFVGGIRLSITCPPDLGTVVADPTQVEQIVLNLAVNARDAMPAGGEVRIELANRDLEGAEAGAYVMLAMTDTGCGMDAGTRERIFEPFFTTKALGKGTGLGLSTVFGIVKQSHGHIHVHTEPGRGARFEVYLPRTAEPAAPVASEVPPATLRGSETILLVEDDPQVREVSRAILRRNGYEVLDAQNGGEAFLICESHAGAIDLLLTDVQMPRMNGRQLAARLVELRPSLRVLYMSGYVDDARPLDPDVEFLAKPAPPTALLMKVRAVLDRS